MNHNRVDKNNNLLNNCNKIKNNNNNYMHFLPNRIHKWFQLHAL